MLDLLRLLGVQVGGLTWILHLYIAPYLMSCFLKYFTSSTYIYLFIIDLMVVLDGGSTLCESGNVISYYLLYATTSDQSCLI